MVDHGQLRRDCCGDGYDGLIIEVVGSRVSGEIGRCELAVAFFDPNILR